MAHGASSLWVNGALSVSEAISLARAIDLWAENREESKTTTSVLKGLLFVRKRKQCRKWRRQGLNNCFFFFFSWARNIVTSVADE